MVKIFGDERSFWAADRVMQIHGGMGLVEGIADRAIFPRSAQHDDHRRRGGSAAHGARPHDPECPIGDCARHQPENDMTAYETLLVEKNDGITTIRFNRPAKKNAMSPTLHREMHAVLRSLEFDDETQVLVITGSGDAFCAGQDLKEYFYANKDSVKQTEEIQRISHEWRHQPEHVPEAHHRQHQRFLLRRGLHHRRVLRHRDRRP